MKALSSTHEDLASVGASGFREVRRTKPIELASASALWIAGLVGCGANNSDTVCPPDESQAAQAIVGGTPDESLLGLGPEDKRAIVALWDGLWPTGQLCTGVLVRSNWVLTGRHCLVMPNPVVDIPQEPESFISARIVNSVPHPTLDVALVEIQPGAPTTGVAAVRPLCVGLDTESVDWVGQRVELAGYGITESGALDGLRYAVETVFELNDFKIRVDGLGRSGACEGDSGGPMLVRGDDGCPTVAGVLSSGSASCASRDSYIRADLIAKWIDSVVEAEPQTPVGCGAITVEGQCQQGKAFRCVDSLLVVDKCEGKELCGWNEANRRFGCVAASNDPCQGVGSLGRCKENVALTCRAGKLDKTHCGACGSCIYASDNGAPKCSEIR